MGPVSVQVLEVCVNHCGGKFHGEVAKFRFLNELIKVLSPKVSECWPGPAPRPPRVHLPLLPPSAQQLAGQRVDAACSLPRLWGS